MSTRKHRVWLVPLGNVPPLIDIAVADALSAAFPCEVQRAAYQVETQFAYDETREQLSSTMLLERLAEFATEPQDRILGITDQDLYIPILTFVFGEAYLNGASAIISTHRLNPTFYGLPYDEGILLQRTCIEAVHEIGHTLGLVHCTDYGCAMHASHSADEIDLKPSHYCSSCNQQIGN